MITFLTFFSTSSAPVTSTNQSVLNAVFNLPSLSNFRNLTQIRNQTQAVSQNKGRAQSSTNSSSDTSSTPSSLDATSNLLSNISRLIAKDTEPERSSAAEQSEILPDCILKFEFEKPDGPEADEQRSYEIASRMLFLSAKWIKNFSSYHSIEVIAQRGLYLLLLLIGRPSSDIYAAHMERAISHRNSSVYIQGRDEKYFRYPEVKSERIH